MKGLFAKDFSILNLLHIPLILALLTITGFFSILPWFSLMLAAIVTGWTTSTITTDQLDTAGPPCSSFPVSRKQYVRENTSSPYLEPTGLACWPDLDRV